MLMLMLNLMPTDRHLPQPILCEEVTGLILAGGRGMRMGGADKGWVMHHGRPLIVHVCDRLQPQVSTLLISANRSLSAYRRLGYPVAEDATASFDGPVAGLLALLPQVRTPWVIATACDMPELPGDLVFRLRRTCHRLQLPMASAYDDERIHPLPICFATRLAPALRAYHAHGGRSLMGWLRALPCALVRFDTGSLRNCNTPESLRTA